MNEVEQYGTIALQEMQEALSRSRSVLYALFGEVDGEKIRTNRALRPLVSRVVESKGEDLAAVAALRMAAEVGQKGCSTAELTSAA
jgi:hypothetical protein